MTVPPDPSSRVARRQQASRARLVKAAAGVIANKGVEGLRLRAVTDAADLGFGSFYSHFASKDELVEAVVVELMTGLAERLIAQVTSMKDVAEAGSAAHRWFVRNAAEDPETAWLIVHLDRADVLFQQAIAPFARPLLERGVRTGRFSVLDVDTTLTYIVGATIAVTRAALEGRLSADAETRSAEVLLRALGLDAADAKDVAARPLPQLGRP